MSLINTVQFITKHPLNKNNVLGALLRYAKWQIRSRCANHALKMPFVNETFFFAKNGWTGVTGNIYCGLHEFEDMSFVIHFLRKKDLFVDIGANMGSYTILASGVCQANTVAVEPILSTFEMLQNNIALNHIQHLVNPQNIGLGAKEGILNFSTANGTMNRVLLHETKEESQQTRIKTLDNLLLAQEDYPISLLKLDVEGYEQAVIEGANITLSDERTKAIIVETNGSENHYGFEPNNLHETLSTHGFTPYSYAPFERILVEKTNLGKFNTIYIRDINFVRERIKNAPKFKVLNWSL
jgi:FkbM family methyltransferase